MLFVNAEDDPLIPEYLLDVPKTFVNSKYIFVALSHLLTFNSRGALHLEIARR